MTRLTPEDENDIRRRQDLGLNAMGDVSDLLAEIDALRAENERLAKHYAGTAAALKVAQAEIATFRNASPSLCNCSQCLDLRKEFAE